MLSSAKSAIICENLRETQQQQQMKQALYFTFFCLWIGLQVVSAQRPPVNTRNFEPYISQSYTLGVGAIAYLGDVPSGVAAIRPAGFFAYSYPFTPKISGRVQVSYGQYGGADSLSSGGYQKSRGVHFRSDLIEANVLMIYEPFKDKRKDFFAKTHLSPYLMYGLSLFYMNPKAKDTDGTWTELQPLGTEGQYLDPAYGTFPKPYKKLQFSVPFGVGLSYYFYRNIFSVNAELMIHKTFTDYMDDVSAKFYPDSYLMNQFSPQAAHFSNPTGVAISESRPRGNPDKLDIYMMPSLSISYYLGY